MFDGIMYRTPLRAVVEPEGDGGPTAQQQSTSTAPLKKDYIQQPSEADDIGNVALFLASDMSRAVDAEIIMVGREGLVSYGLTDCGLNSNIPCSVAPFDLEHTLKWPRACLLLSGGPRCK